MKSMKKLLLLVVASLAGVLLAACSHGIPEGNSEEAASEETTEAASEESSEELIEMALIVGNLGDMSFADSANSGREQIEEEFGDQVQTTVIEFGNDMQVIDNYFLEAADAGYDIVAMPSQFVEVTQSHAPDYPEVDFWLYGTAFDFDQGNYDNVYAMQYRSNEAAYLAGFLEASRSETDMLGMIGGMDNSVINDFMYGFIQGAQHAKPEAQVMTSYIGSFEDTARGKDLALAQYQQGASSVFNIAGPAGVGIAEGAVESERQMIGVDSDQAEVFEVEGRTELAEVTPTSVLTNVGASLFLAMEDYLSGNLVMGEQASLGLKEGAVGLAVNNYYNEYYDEHLQAEVEQIEEQISTGDITVDTVYDLSVEEYQAIRDSVAP